MDKGPTPIYFRTILVFILVSIAGALLIFLESHKYIDSKKQSAVQIASIEASVLSQRLNASISLTYTLEALLRERGYEINQDALDKFSKHLLESHPSISSLQYSPNGVVQFISPLAGNEAAVGHDLLEDPKRNKEAFDSVEKRILTVAGPFELIQGGVALVARLPIFRETKGSESFWGFSTVLIKVADLMNSATINNLKSLGYSWNIFRVHPDTKQPHVFYGSSLDLLGDRIEIAINAPNATWYLCLRPVDGWLADHYTSIFVMCAIWFLVSSVVTFFSYKFFKQPYELKKQVDIRTTELREAKDVIAQSEQRLRQIAENNQMWIWEVDSKGLYTYCSDACLPILGFRAEEIIGEKYFYDLFHPEDKGELMKASFDAFGHRLPINDFENRNLSKDGEVVWLSTSGVPVIDQNGELIGYRGADIDITTRKKLTEEHGRAAQLAILGTVAAGVAHEINNPINGIINYAQLLKSKANDPEVVLDLAGRISKESDRIAKITSDLLHYSKDSRDEFIHVNVKEVIDSALSLIAPKIKHKGIYINSNISDDLPEFKINPQSIQQVIINLVDNAYDALRYKGGSSENKVISIEAHLNKHDGTQLLCIDVMDNGIGMPSDVVKKAKDAFFTTKPSIEGSGLGLSIVNEIVGKHSGHFNIESVEGEFTRVSICLPLNSSFP